MAIAQRIWQGIPVSQFIINLQVSLDISATVPSKETISLISTFKLLLHVFLAFQIVRFCAYTFSNILSESARFKTLFRPYFAKTKSPRAAGLQVPVIDSIFFKRWHQLRLAFSRCQWPKFVQAIFSRVHATWYVGRSVVPSR